MGVRRAVWNEQPIAVSSARAAGSRKPAVRCGLRGGQRARCSCRFDAHRRSDRDSVILGRWRGHRNASRPLEQHCADYWCYARRHAGRNMRLFALLNIAMADAAICSWDAKYTYHFWRPVTAIAFAEPQLNWMSFIVTPPFPDYTSGHSTFSAAAATVLALFYGTEDLPFTTGSDFLPGMYRSFPTCLDAAEEAAVSRLYGGIHFRSANEDGLQAGISIGEWTGTHYLQPKGNRSRR